MILIISLILWILTYFPNYNPQVNPDKVKGLNEKQVDRIIESERLTHSFAAKFGNVIEPVLKPLGWDWRIGVSLISAFAAREVFVGALAMTMSITEDEETNMQKSLLNSMKNAKFEDTNKPLFTTASTVALIIYFMFAMQCLSTVVIAKKETGSWRIPLIQIFLYTSMAYVLAFAIYHGLHLVGVS